MRRITFDSGAEYYDAREVDDFVKNLMLIVEAIAYSLPDDSIGDIKVDIPKDGYPRQYIRNAARELIGV